MSRPQIIDSGAKDRRPPVSALVVGKPYDVGPACPKVGAVWGKDSGASHHARPLQRIYMKEGTIDLPGRSAISADRRIRLGGAWEGGQTEFQCAVVRYGCGHIVTGHCRTGRHDTRHKGRSRSRIRVGIHSLMKPGWQGGGGRVRSCGARRLTQGESDSARHEDHCQEVGTGAEPSHTSNDSTILIWNLGASGVRPLSMALLCRVGATNQHEGFDRSAIGRGSFTL